MQSTLAEANKVAEETISAMRTVRSFANEDGEADSYYAKLMVMFQLNKKQAIAYAFYMWSSCVGISSLPLSTEQNTLNPLVSDICFLHGFLYVTISVRFVCVLQISELVLEVAILYYGGHLVITNQMSSGALISFFIYMLELGECLEVFHPC